LYSRYHDLTFTVHAGQRLLALLATDAPVDYIAVRSLWSAIVVAYGRAFVSGRLRTLRVKEANRFYRRWPRDHQAMMAMRHEQVAHAGDDTAERILIAAEYRAGDPARIAVSDTVIFAHDSSQVEFIINHAGRVRDEVAEAIKVRSTALGHDFLRDAERFLTGEDVTSAFEGASGPQAEGPLGGHFSLSTPANRGGAPE